MKTQTPCLLRQRALLLATAFGLALAGASAAQAFSFSDQDAGGSAGQNFRDLDSKAPKTDLPASRFGSSTSSSTVTQGNTTFQFGGNGGSFDQRYNPSNLFDPYARDGR